MFKKFILSLNESDKANYLNYSRIRGIQQYRIVYDALRCISTNVTYRDVNALIINDKAIKDTLYVYLGTLEEFIRNYILENFDFDSSVELKKDKYVFFDRLPKIVKSDNNAGEITELYKRYALTFGSMVELIEEYKIECFNIEKLKEVNELRNNVMHHSPLLFDYNSNSLKESVKKQIKALFELLPDNYKDSMYEQLLKSTNATKYNLNKEFHNLLLFEE